VIKEWIATHLLLQYIILLIQGVMKVSEFMGLMRKVIRAIIRQYRQITAILLESQLTMTTNKQVDKRKNQNIDNLII